MKRIIVLASLTALILTGCKESSRSNDESVSTANVIPAPAAINYNIMAVYPHDTTAFTEGLQWINNSLDEGTGLEGKSNLMKVNINSGKAEKSISIDPTLFGEGITVL